MVSLSNLAPNEKLTMSMVKDALFNEKAQRKEMGMVNSDDLPALVLERSRERGQEHQRGTKRG